MTSPITRDQLRAALDEGTVTVVDALPASPYGQRHIPRALNPVEDDAGARSSDLLPDRHATIVTYSTDRACGRGEALAVGRPWMSPFAVLRVALTTLARRGT